MIAVGHVATITADLDRLRAFYARVFGIEAAVVLRMDGGPGLRHAFFPVDERTLLHVFEQPGYDPAADGHTDVIGHRGRLDHFAFLLDAEAFETARRSLVAAGATDGAIQDFGPFRQVYFEDPDGMPCEISTIVDGYDPAEETGEIVLEVADPRWFERLRNSVAPPVGV